MKPARIVTPQFSTENKVVVTADAQLNKNYFAKTKVGVDYKDEPDGFNYGVAAELALPTSTYSVNTGVRFEGHSGHLRVSNISGVPALHLKLHPFKVD